MRLRWRGETARREQPNAGAEPIVDSILDQRRKHVIGTHPARRGGAEVTVAVEQLEGCAVQNRPAAAAPAEPAQSVASVPDGSLGIGSLKGETRHE